MSIRQFNGNYMPNDDRLLFRFNTADDSEYRFWFTRRVTLFIMAATEHLVEKKLEQKHDQPTAKAIAQFQQEAIKEKANFVSEYQAANKFPLGADPVLVVDVKCTMLQAEGVDVLSMDLVLPGGANLNLRLTVPILQTMRLLLERLAQQANWGQMHLVSPNEQIHASKDDSISDQGLVADNKKNLH